MLGRLADIRASATASAIKSPSEKAITVSGSRRPPISTSPARAVTRFVIRLPKRSTAITSPCTPPSASRRASAAATARPSAVSR